MCTSAVTTRRSLDEIESLAPERILISPGPGRPEDAGITLDVIRRFGSQLPLMGVCLGHQAIGLAFGGDVVRAPVPMHGKTCTVAHDAKGVFAGITSSFQASRYHSLVVARREMARGAAGLRALQGGWPGDGAASPRVADARRAVSPRVDPHARGAPDPAQFSGALMFQGADRKARTPRRPHDWRGGVGHGGNHARRGGAGADCRIPHRALDERRAAG